MEGLIPNPVGDFAWRADLHVHTDASDGAWTPQQLVQAAVAQGLQAIAVTDHDTTLGVSPVQQYAAGTTLAVIPGVELSTRRDPRTEEIHIVGLWVDPENQALVSATETMRTNRQSRAGKIVGRLHDLGIPISYDRIKEVAQQAAIGRVHIARVLVEMKYAANVSDAFRKYLAEGAAAYVPRFQLTPPSAISAIHSAGGVAVCAHPGLLDDDSIITHLVASGLDGLEVRHSAHTPQDVIHYSKLAKELDLLPSGGSDCHGLLPGKKPLLGTVFVDRKTVEKLLVRAEKYR